MVEGSGNSVALQRGVWRADAVVLFDWPMSVDLNAVPIEHGLAGPAWSWRRDHSGPDVVGCFGDAGLDSSDGWVGISAPRPRISLLPE